MIYDINGNKILETKYQKNVFSIEPFKSDDQQTKVSTSSAVFALYDALVSAYPNYCRKITHTKSTLTNYEYVFTSGAYNSYSSTAYHQDPSTAKPKILVASGIHGLEQAAAMANYVFFKSLCEAKPGLEYVREAFEWHTIPIVNQYSYDHYVRLNANGVDINRNFDADWVKNTATHYYSGEYPASELETQLIQDWLDEHNDAVFFLDHHNSDALKELCFLQCTGNQGNQVLIKNRIMYVFNTLISYWKLGRNLPSDSKWFYCLSATNDRGLMCNYAAKVGIPSALLETSWNVDNTGNDSQLSIGVGAEAEAMVLLGACTWIDAKAEAEKDAQ